jgi:hypothetical protein
MRMSMRGVTCLTDELGEKLEDFGHAAALRLSMGLGQGAALGMLAA